MSLLSSVLAGGFFNISATWEAIFRILKPKGVSRVVQMVKNWPAMWEIWVLSLGGEDPLEKEMSTHSSILAWRIHEQRNLAGYSPWDHKSRTQLSD